MDKFMGKIIVTIVIISVIIIGALNAFYILADGQQAIIERFGEKYRIEKKAGIKVKVPFIDEVKIVETDQVYTLQYGYRVQSTGDTRNAAQYLDVPNEATVLTERSYIVNVEAMIQYRIVDVDSYYYNVDDPEETLRIAFESVLRRNVQNKNIDDALLNKGVISSETLPELTKKINDYGLGLHIDSLEIQNINLPEEVQESYENVNNARNRKDELLDLAKKYEHEIIPDARAQAQALIEDARGYYAETVKQAKGDIAMFNEIFEKYQHSKEITRTRLKIEMMEEVLKTVKSKYIIDMENSNGLIKYLPLSPNNIQQSGGATNE